jgi:chemotaxis methyl-accepting protein methylase
MSRRNQINRIIFDFAPMSAIGRCIYANRHLRQKPAQSTVTHFFRNLEQLSALGNSISNLARQGRLRILVSGCSMGCEAFTIAGYFAKYHPTIEFEIHANDISVEALQVAEAGIFGREHGLGVSNDAQIEDLEARMFQPTGDQWCVKSGLRERVHFSRADVLSSEFKKFHDFDIVFGQNFMIHMSLVDEAVAFGNLTAAVRPGGALVVGGMHLEQRAALAEANGLHAVDWNIAAIHNADIMRRNAWPWSYWSLEPLDHGVTNFVDRYASIFVKPILGDFATS